MEQPRGFGYNAGCQIHTAKNYCFANMNNPFTKRDLGQIRRLCRLLRAMLLVFLIVQIGFFILAWLLASPFQLGPWLMQVVPDDMTAEMRQAMPPLQRLLGFAVGLPPVALLV
jgi:hypothetical protein